MSTASVGIRASRPIFVPPGINRQVNNYVNPDIPFLNVSTDTTAPGGIAWSGRGYPGDGWIHTLRGAGGLSIQGIYFQYTGLSPRIRTVAVHCTHNGVGGTSGYGIRAVQIICWRNIINGEIRGNFVSPTDLAPGESVTLEGTSTDTIQAITVGVYTYATNFIPPAPTPIVTVPFVGFSESPFSSW